MKMKTPPATLVVSLALVLISAGCRENASTDDKARPLSAESSASVTLDEIDPAGLAKAVERHRGRVVLVDYWATWCIPCRELIPHSVELRDRYGGQGLTVITVSLNKPDERDAVLEFLGSHRANVENYLNRIESDAEAIKGFEIEGGSLPYLRVFDRSGRLFRVISGDQPDQIDRAVAEALEKSD